MKIKKTITIALVVGVISAMGVAYAAVAKTPAEIVSGLTGKSVTQLTEERSQGKTYGTIAKEAGKLDEFKAQMLEERKIMLDELVKEGKLTQERADAIYENMKNNQLSCDGTGNARMGGRQCGVGSGAAGCTGTAGSNCGMSGSGNGRANGRGMGCGR